jgi:hypothetical protein
VIGDAIWVINFLNIFVIFPSPRRKFIFDGKDLKYSGSVPFLVSKSINLLIDLEGTIKNYIII